LLPDGDEGVLDRVRHEVAVVALPGEPDREPLGVALVQRAEGAHVAFGHGEKQRLIVRAAVHALPVASPARKRFTPRREFPPGLPRPRDRTNPARAAHGATANGPRVLIYCYRDLARGAMNVAAPRLSTRSRCRALPGRGNASAEDGGELDRVAANAARTTLHQHPLPRL
jgi:hypothetical protein